MFLSRGRTMGFSTANRIAINEMTAMIVINPALSFMESLDLVMIWRELDEIVLNHLEEERKRKESKRDTVTPNI
jgi:hypothetical protein